MTKQEEMDWKQLSNDNPNLDNLFHLKINEILEVFIQRAKEREAKLMEAIAWLQKHETKKLKWTTGDIYNIAAIEELE